MGWTQLAGPNTSVQDQAGWCLRFTQAVFGAPARYYCAYDAWVATSLKHADRSLPEGVSVPVWYTWWGTINGEYRNWGHACAAIWIPEEGRHKILSSPPSGYGQAWFNDIDHMARAYNLTYEGWSEDLNGLQTVSFTSQPIPTGDDDMYAKVNIDTGIAYLWNMASGVHSHIAEMPDYVQIDSNLKTWKFATEADFANFKARFATVLPLTVDANAIATAVVAQLGNVQIDVDALATAIADKIDCCNPSPTPAPDVTTKAEIIASIEANYPEDTK